MIIKASLSLKKIIGTCTIATNKNIIRRIKGITPFSFAMFSRRFDLIDFPYIPNASMGEDMNIIPIKINPIADEVNPLFVDWCFKEPKEAKNIVARDQEAIIVGITEIILVLIVVSS